MMDPEVLTLLREIRDRLDALPAAFAAATRQGDCGKTKLRPADEKALTALLPVIAAAVANRVFTVRELFEHSRLEIEPAVELRERLDAVGNSRTVGRLLRRGANVDVGAYRLVPYSQDREGRMWELITAKTRDN